MVFADTPIFYWKIGVLCLWSGAGSFRRSYVSNIIAEQRNLMKSSLFIVAFSMSLLSSAPVFARDNACMIEGRFIILGQTIESRDCMQAAPDEKEASFRASCEQLANASAAMGGKPGKVTYMAQCSKPAQGICKNVLGSQRDAYYYYERSADDLASLPQGCARGGGRWLSGK